MLKLRLQIVELIDNTVMKFQHMYCASADLSGDLLPRLMKSNSSREDNLVVSTLVGSAKCVLTYNNLSEIIKTSNTQGRRSNILLLVIKVADQSLSANAREDVYSSSV